MSISDRITKFHKDYSKGIYSYERKGQAFCNVFDLTWPELFYETDTKKINRMISEWADSQVISEPDESMDGDHTSALASAGWGTDEDYS